MAAFGAANGGRGKGRGYQPTEEGQGASKGCHGKSKCWQPTEGGQGATKGDGGFGKGWQPTQGSEDEAGPTLLHHEAIRAGRDAFVKHLTAAAPAWVDKDMKAKLLLAWKWITGESDPDKRFFNAARRIRRANRKVDNLQQAQEPNPRVWDPMEWPPFEIDTHLPPAPPPSPRSSSLRKAATVDGPEQNTPGGGSDPSTYTKKKKQRVAAVANGGSFLRSRGTHQTQRIPKHESREHNPAKKRWQCYLCTSRQVYDWCHHCGRNICERCWRECMACGFGQCTECETCDGGNPAPPMMSTGTTPASTSASVMITATVAATWSTTAADGIQSAAMYIMTEGRNLASTITICITAKLITMCHYAATMDRDRLVRRVSRMIAMTALFIAPIADSGWRIV